MVEIAFLPLAYESDEGQDYSLTTARLQYNIRAALEPASQTHWVQILISLLDRVVILDRYLVFL